MTEKTTKSREELKKSIKRILEADQEIVDNMDEGLAKKQVEKVRAL